jgi:hypothetical protein
MAIVDPGVADEAQLLEQGTELAAEYAEDAIGAPRYAADTVGSGGRVSNLFAGVDAADREELLLSGLRSDASIFDAARDLGYRPDDLGAELADTRGMLYWYYVLAGRLAGGDQWNAGLAWDAALAWDGDEVLVTETANGVCVEATIATTDEAGRLLMLDALRQWAAAGPVGAGTTVNEIGTEQISVFSCDPGADADTVLNEQIPAFGETPAELDIIGELGAQSTAERACVINAVRGFDVLAIIASGDQARSETAISDIGGACVTG